ncbi:PQQ-binding-like beta-propeller repeat protein [Natronococcus sp. JC468]|uniref:outer membrane protein assembly factor BamB family protein n=1 Tax=Natronococcus sp. JC468 TaxID=1961921 RepID=UPI00143C514C|nr:PQQ-binding-like beta-propeller repeat protein [Natronococcus sp. JC468]NKE37735.1 PQQ-binding-like beta-propeller repeat protein [Natronococcus sp. JC468]
MAELDPETGETRWSGPVDAGTAALSATDRTLLIQNNSHEGVYVFDAETKETGELLSDAYVTAAADGVAVTQGRYRVGATAIGGSDATAEWSHEGAYTHGLPVIAGDTVVVTHSTPGPETDDAVVGFDLEDGDERWRFMFDDGENWNDGADADYLVVENDAIYVPRGTDLVAIRPDDWEKAEPEDETETDQEDSSDGEGSDDSDEGDGNSSDDGTDDDTIDGSEGTGNDTENERGDENGSSDGNGTDDDAGETGSDGDADGTPGFTVGAGAAGGALGLEWLRRRGRAGDDLEE